MRILFFIPIFLLSSLCCLAQQEDNIWMFGSAIYDEVLEFVHLDTTWGATNIDFNYCPPKIYYDHDRLIDFRATNSSIADDQSNIIMYTNGQAIWDGDNEYIEDTIGYGDYWENWLTKQDDIVVREGYPLIQGALILNMEEKDEELYYVIYSYFNLDNLVVTNLNYTKVSINNNDAIVEEKDVKIIIDSLPSGCLNAVQHANGKYWWIFKMRINTGKLEKFLLDSNGIKYKGYQYFGDYYESTTGQLYFTPDGSIVAINMISKYFDLDSKVAIADFDRCTGKISNVIEERIDGNRFAQGLSFSPNSKLLYVTDALFLYQYDLESDDIIGSRVMIEEYDGFEYFYPPDTTFPWPVELGWMGLAPDGKIYISTTAGSNRVMGKINNPNIKGIGCDMDQHSVFLNTSYARGMPNFPNFRLGPLDGSSCDTLGIDNHPIAKYRYVQDSLENLKIHFFDLSYYDPRDYDWDFGDSYTSDMLEPTHVYESTGVYEVCLTVSNDYDTHTTCKTIMLGTTATEEEEYNANITLFPNPVSDYLTVSFHDYLGLDMVLKLYDVRGNLVNDYPLEGAYTILDLRDLTSGVYVYRIFDGRVELENGKVIFGGD